MKRGAVLLILGCGVVWLPLGVYAANSTHYQIVQSVLGGTGSLNGSSTHYQAASSVGAAAVGGQYPAGGNGQSTHYQANGGYVTSGDPALGFAVSGGTSINLGNLSPASTVTGSSTFNVIDYTSYGYIVQIIGTPPTNGSHTLAAMSGSGSSIGTEQFGINLAANSIPSIGAAPSGGLGVASSGYNTSNSYTYSNGGTIASAPKSSAQTNFTISYIANTAPTTPTGSYSSSLTLVCTGTY
jgi:hypothetical protein